MKILRIKPHPASPRLRGTKKSKLKLKSKILIADIKDVVAPARCMGCLVEGSWLCAACEQSLPNTALVQRDVKKLTGIISAGSYGLPTLKRGIAWLKFKSVKPLAKPLSLLMIRGLLAIAPLAELQEQAALVPIPLHKRRLRKRGFNQSEEMVKVLEEYTGIPIADVLVRKKSTWTQTRLPPEMREENTKGAFALKVKKLPEKKFWILVDDVTTTGSTLSAAAEALKEKNVWGVTVARG